VLYQGSDNTVCTTYEGHIPELQSAGGTESKVTYGCSVGDLVCVTFENAGRGMALAAMGVMFLFAQNVTFDTSTLLWDAAVGEWSFWQWATLIVVFIAMVWAVTAAVVARDREQLVGAMVRSFIAIPAVPLTLWLTGHTVNAVDDMTWYILAKDGPSHLLGVLQEVMWSGGEANYFFAFLVHGLLLVAMVLLMFVFAFRNLVLAALIMVGPVAWMVFPVRSIGPQWVVRYVSALAVLLLTGPLTIGFVSLIVRGLAEVRSIWDPQSWPLLLGLALVTFAPFAVFGLFSFVGAAAADGLGSALGTGGRRLASSTGARVAAIPSRVGASPAGVLAGASRGGTATRAVTSRPVGGAGNAAGGRGATRPGTSTAPAPTPAGGTATTTSAATPNRPTPAASAAPTPAPQQPVAPQRIERSGR
jgi:hypothetical protein